MKIHSDMLVKPEDIEELRKFVKKSQLFDKFHTGAITVLTALVLLEGYFLFFR